MEIGRLPRSFFARPTLTVARELLGQRLVCLDGTGRLSGRIVEAEAYIGEEDLACHARHGRTPRNAAMYGPPGHAYVYFTYGLHWMLNAVTEREGFPAAVLLRAILPEDGLATMRQRRQKSDTILTDGPAKLTQALGIDRRFNSHDLCAPDARLFVEQAPPPPGSHLVVGARIGLGKTPEPWRSKPWNFRLRIAD